VGAVWWITSDLLKTALVPEKCRWCYRAEDGTDLLNPYDGWMRSTVVWKNTAAADTASTIVVFFVEPGVTMGLTALSAAYDQALGGFPLDALLIAEATILAGDVNQLAKFAFARERPFVHFLPRAPIGIRELTASPSDDNLSFFSGHTTLGFALATSAGMISTLRGYRLAPLVWGTGLTTAVTVGYLRIAADMHYFSDVMTAAVVGSVIGIGVPLLFHSPVSSDASTASATGQPLELAVPGAFTVSGMF
jgi:membrane-associated phospholipid phosphatase